MSKNFLIAMRVKNLRVTHPEATYEHHCDTCGEVLCLFPSGQRILREHGAANLEFRCNVCFEEMPESTLGEWVIPKEVLQEYKETINFTKRKA